MTGLSFNLSDDTIKSKLIRLGIIQNYSELFWQLTFVGQICPSFLPPEFCIIRYLKIGIPELYITYIMPLALINYKKLLMHQTRND